MRTVEPIRVGHPFLIDGERVQLVDRPGGLLHIRRLDFDGKLLGCGAKSRGTREHGEPTLEWLYDRIAPSGLLCERCKAALDRYTRVYGQGKGE